MDAYVQNVDFSSAYRSMKSHTDFNPNMNDKLQNGDVSSGIGILNSHTTPNITNQEFLNDMNRVDEMMMSVVVIVIITVPLDLNQMIAIPYFLQRKGYEISPNTSKMEKTGL